MERHTGNTKVVGNVPKALKDFVADHLRAAQEDPEWIKEAKT
jgi:hypothetical protein